MDRYKNYKRELILLNRTTAILLHIFTKEDEHSYEDMDLYDNDEWQQSYFDVHEEAAKQFISQLEGHECVRFIKCLKNECEKYLEENEKRILKMEKLRNEAVDNK